MSNFPKDYDDSFYFWQRGMFIHCPYTKTTQKDMVKYVFYTDMNLDGSAGEHQLAAEIVKRPDEPIGDQEIAKAFCKSISDKILTDVGFDQKNYIGCFATLPKGFYTEMNVEQILENITTGSRELSKVFKKETERQAFEIGTEIACCDLMEYAHSQNAHVRKGTGREHIGD